MSLQEKSLQELTELKAKLLKHIQSNPEHSGIERVELEDIQGWIDSRIRERDHKRLTEPAFESSDN
jgi:hypothetical protein